MKGLIASCAAIALSLGVSSAFATDEALIDQINDCEEIRAVAEEHHAAELNAYQTAYDSARQSLSECESEFEKSSDRAVSLDGELTSALKQIQNLKLRLKRLRRQNK